MTTQDDLRAAAAERLKCPPDPEKRRLWNQEHAILEVTELICELLENAGVSRVQLAERMGVSKGSVTQMLDGRNMTLRTVADVLTALGCRLKVSAQLDV